MHIMVAKIARRKHKLALVRTQADERIVRYVDGCMNKARAELARRQERLFHDPAPTLHIAQLGSLDFAQDVVHQLPDVDKFVKSIPDREKIMRQTEFCRTGHPAEFKPDRLPTFSSTTPEYITATLAAFEKWVADHLDAWIVAHASDWDACAKLGTLMKTYQGLAYTDYAKNPEGTSVLVLTVLELWIACDKSATALDSLLKEYSPRVPAQLLQSLLLPYRDQMVRLEKAELYILERTRTADPSLPPSSSPSRAPGPLPCGTTLRLQNSRNSTAGSRKMRKMLEPRKSSNSPDFRTAIET
ncbi:hypothetical protein RB594_008448 [Gaeumannomyces avenae]